MGSEVSGGLGAQQRKGQPGNQARMASPRSLAQAQSPLLLLQVGSHFRLPETIQAVEAGGQVPGQLVGPHAVSQLVSSLRALALLWGWHVGRGVLRKPGKVHQPSDSRLAGHKGALGQIMEGPSVCLSPLHPPAPASTTRPRAKKAALTHDRGTESYTGLRSHSSRGSGGFQSLFIPRGTGRQPITH